MKNPLPLFQQYTPYDMEIVMNATRCNLYLIGGTAIDLLCRYYSVPFWRNRSNNDFDFWTSSDNQGKDRFIKLLSKEFGIADEYSSDYHVSLTLRKAHIDTDILIDYDCTNKQFAISVNGIFIMSPTYLFASKFDRYINCSNQQRKDTDFKDLQVLLSIIEKTNGIDELERYLSTLNYDQEAENLLNSIIMSML